MKSTDYELLVREIFQHLLNQDFVPNVVVEHDVVKQGLRTTHQIDVYWEFELGGIIYRTVVQAKNWAKAIDQGELLKFQSVLSDLPGQPRGIIVTARGYQEGALEVASRCGIKIYEFKEEAQPPLQLSYTGWAVVKPMGYCNTVSGEPFAMVMDTEIVTPEFSNLKFNADAGWHQEDGRGIPSLPQVKFFPHEIEFYDADQRLLRTLREIYSDLAKQVNSRGEINASEIYSFDGPTFMKAPSTSSLIKVTSLSVEVTLKIEHQKRIWRIGNVALFILKSLDDGKTRQFARFPGADPPLPSE
jgi:Restriction endonuclease